MNRVFPTASGWLERVVTAYGRGRPLAVLFDYDGTLTPIVRHPSLARLDPRTRERLSHLAALPEVRVGVISGRALGDVRSLIGLKDVYYAGSGGLEIDLLGEEERCPVTDPIGLLLDAIQDQMVELLQKFPKTWVERKPGALTVHFRGLLPLAASCFRIEAISLLAVIDEVRFRVVSEAIEVTPADGWDKGMAVVSIMSHMEESGFKSPLAVYFGDEVNDTEAMEIAARSGGAAVGVGPDAPPPLDQRLADPKELVTCLDDLLARLPAARGRPSGSPVERPEREREETPCGVGGEKTPAAGAGLLLLDPNQDTRQEMAATMSALGWRVWQADTPERAAEVFTRHGDEVQVALVDLQLPGLQGARALAEFGKTRPDLIRGCLSEDVSPYVAAAFDVLSDVPLFVKPFHGADADRFFRDLLRRKQDR